MRCQPHTTPRSALALVAAVLLVTAVGQLEGASSRRSPGVPKRAAAFGALAPARPAGLNNLLSNLDVLNASGAPAVAITFHLESATPPRGEQPQEIAIHETYNSLGVDPPVNLPAGQPSAELTWAFPGADAVAHDDVAHFGYTIETQYGIGVCPLPVFVDQTWTMEDGSTFPMPETLVDTCGGAGSGTDPLNAAAPFALRGLSAPMQEGTYAPLVRNLSNQPLHVVRSYAFVDGELGLEDLMRDTRLWANRTPIDATARPLAETGGEVRHDARLDPGVHDWVVFMVDVHESNGDVAGERLNTVFQAVYAGGYRSPFWGFVPSAQR